jgi:uncharacterized protein with HEPN domain
MRPESAYLQDHTFESFIESSMAKSAVLYQLAIIGEAAGKLSDQTRATAGNIPWQQIKRMRNVLMHDYFGVQLRIVWETATEGVPELADAVKSLLPPGGESDPKVSR